MESEIERNPSAQQNGLYALGEIVLVFLPVLLIILVMRSWVGQDPIRSFIVVWVANIVMLSMAWTAMKLRDKSWKELGLTFTRISFHEGLRTFWLSLVVFVFGIVAFLIGPVILAIVTEIPESADFTKYAFLRDNPWGLVVSLAGVYIVSSFGEEVIYRAFLIERISEMARSSRYSVVIAVFLSSVIFGLAHYEWGFLGVIQTGLMGLAMGICYIKFKKRLWSLILAHAYMDTILLVQLYIASN